MFKYVLKLFEREPTVW